MDETTRTNLANLRSEDREAQNKAFYAIMEVSLPQFSGHG